MVSFDTSSHGHPWLDDNWSCPYEWKKPHETSIAVLPGLGLSTHPSASMVQGPSGGENIPGPVRKMEIAMRIWWGWGDYGDMIFGIPPWICDNCFRLGELPASFGHFTWDNDYTWLLGYAIFRQIRLRTNNYWSCWFAIPQIGQQRALKSACFQPRPCAGHTCCWCLLKKNLSGIHVFLPCCWSIYIYIL
jgi:hypothetical protein